MNVNITLCDFAQVYEGKLNILGGGWNEIGPGPVSFGIGILIEVPWDQTNKRHHVTIALQDADGGGVELAQGMLRVDGEFEVGRPPGATAGASMNVPLAFNFAGVPIPAGGRFVFVVDIDGHSDADWRASFNTRQAPVNA